MIHFNDPIQFLKLYFICLKSIILYLPRLSSISKTHSVFESIRVQYVRQLMVDLWLTPCLWYYPFCNSYTNSLTSTMLMILGFVHMYGCIYFMCFNKLMFWMVIDNFILPTPRPEFLTV